MDYVGKKINLLNVIENTGRSDKKRGKIYLCKCDCGNFVEVPAAYLKKNKYSCGCIRRPRKDKGIKRSQIKRNGTRLYRIWKSMRTRCNNPNHEYYSNYGGRGISVCTEWNDFLKFRKWSLENGYSDDLSIDRIDNDDNYSPNNCRWSTRKEQNNNQRSNLLLTYRGETKTAAQWADDLGLTRATIYHRIERGWNDKRIIETPMRVIRNSKTWEGQFKKTV